MADIFIKVGLILIAIGTIGFLIEDLIYNWITKKKLSAIKELMDKTSQRPTNYRELSPEKQWEIDKDLGILDL